MSRHIEDDHQQALINWARCSRIRHDLFSAYRIIDFLIAIPNGGKRNPREAARLKAQGVKAGVSDLLLALPLNNKAGLWIEMKRPIVKGKKKPITSDTQIEWQNKMITAGYDAVVCFGLDEAKDQIEKYLYVQ